MKPCDETIEHLAKDRQTWLRLSAEAKSEAESDEMLIRKLENLKKEVVL